LRETKWPQATLVNGCIVNLVEREKEYKFAATYAEHIVLTKRILEHYSMEYSTQQWKVHGVEMGLETTLKGGDIFTGRIDLNITNQHGNKYIVDHKTTSWSMAQLKKTLSATDQGTGYIFLWNKTHPEIEHVNGIIFNIVRHYKDKTELDHHLVYRTPEDLIRFELDVANTFAELSEKIAEGGRFVRNTASCYLYNRPCPYLDLCNGTNYEGLIGVTFKKREVDDGDQAWPYEGD